MSASADASRFSARKRSYSRPVASAAPTKSRATVGNTPETDIHLGMRLARNWSTWSLCSFIPPEWCGRRVSPEFSLPRVCAATGESSRTRKADALCSISFPTTTKRRRPTTKKKAGVIPRAIKTRGVFLDISWIKKKLPNAEEYIKRKLPSMYHQFKQLADIDITKEPMEVGPTTHYIMGGVHVDP